MTVAELMARLSVLNPDALVIKPYDNHGDKHEYVEIGDWMQVIDVHQANDAVSAYYAKYHWWDHMEGDHTKGRIVKEAVVL